MYIYIYIHGHAGIHALPPTGIVRSVALMRGGDANVRSLPFGIPPLVGRQRASPPLRYSPLGPHPLRYSPFAGRDRTADGICSASPFTPTLHRYYTSQMINDDFIPQTPPPPNTTHSSETLRSAGTRVYRAGQYRPETHRYRRKG